MTDASLGMKRVWPCHFCGKDEDRPRLIIAAKPTAVCGECIWLCVGIMDPMEVGRLAFDEWSRAYMPTQCGWIGDE